MKKTSTGNLLHQAEVRRLSVYRESNNFEIAKKRNYPESKGGKRCPELFLSL